MRRVIIGTAGHIDHGKTTLVKAMTGVKTDRLKEEIKRGISIELGFAPFVLPSGKKAAIVDVPGHERFIKHMLAGAFGIDMVILAIAADEGVMPQTREHIDIIELLGVNKGIAVITKKDLVDEEWLMLIEEEVREYLDKTVLKGSPIIAVASTSGAGIEELLNEIEKIAENIEERSIAGEVRLPIDRVFTISGFGTVITGTLWSGKIKTGETVELMPGQKPVRIRTLHVHNQKVDTVYAGQRVAVNIQGVDLLAVKRGHSLATPGYLKPSFRVDAKLRLLESSTKSIKNWNRIRFHLGTDETFGRVVLLDRDQLKPGEEGYVQIVFEKPVVGHKGDPFVIRYYSPVTTIGGGTIIDANAPKQKRFREEVLQDLAIKEEGSTYDLALHELTADPERILSIKELGKKIGKPEDKLKEDIQQLLDDEQIVEMRTDHYISNHGLDIIKEKITSKLAEYHQKYRLREGYPKEDMRSRVFAQLDSKTFNLLLKYFEQQNILISKNNQIKLAAHKPKPGEKEEKALQVIIKEMEAGLFQPPAKEELRKLIDVDEQGFMELMSYLIDKGLLIKINADMYFSHQAVEEGKKRLNQYFANEKELSLATARDLLQTTRKFALPLVDYYDRIRFTRRIGDMRIKIK